MSDVIRDLERVANWQADRRQQSWTDKVRQAERVRTDVEAWRRVREEAAPTPRLPHDRDDQTLTSPGRRRGTATTVPPTS